MNGDRPRPPTAAGAPSWHRPHWQRLLVVHLAQLFPLAILLLVPGPAGRWTAGLLGSAICSYGTDSDWRWRNRLLLAEAVCWLLVPLLSAG